VQGLDYEALLTQLQTRHQVCRVRMQSLRSGASVIGVRFFRSHVPRGQATRPQVRLCSSDRKYENFRGCAYNTWRSSSGHDGG
jgi:hypothetical protein